MLIQRQTMADAATAAVRELIMSGELPEGAALRQDDLAKRLGISRTPLREAITRLDGEGLVRTDRHRGAVVRKPSAAELSEVYEIRELLECHAGRLAAERVTDAGIEHLRALLAQFEEATSIEDWAQLNSRFHNDMYALAGRTQLSALIAQMRNRSEFYVRVLVSTPGRSQEAEEDHRQILDALERRDAQAVEDTVRTHLRHTVAAVRQNLEEPDRQEQHDEIRTHRDPRRSPA